MKPLVCHDGVEGFYTNEPRNVAIEGEFCRKTFQIIEEENGQQWSKYDWWQATITLPTGVGRIDQSTGEVVDPAKWLVDWLAHQLTMCDVVYGRGSQSYTDRADIRRGDNTLCTVQWGGVNSDPNVTATGSSAPLVRDLVFSHFPEGRVSRVDSAFDSLSGTAEFDRVTAWAEAKAVSMGINCTWIRNSDKAKGDTLYIGSKTSRVQIRIYEKGKQMDHKAGSWWRAEVQLRPESRNKAGVYHFSSGMVWGASRMTRALWEFLGGEGLAAGVMEGVDKQRGLESRVAHLVTQYGALFREMVESEGSWSGVGAMMDAIADSLGKPRITPVEAGERG